jgi:hypothetical protein
MPCLGCAAANFLRIGAKSMANGVLEILSKDVFCG